MERIYTTKDAAKLLAYSVRQITQKCADHKIAGYKLPGGRKWLIPESEIKRFQENGDRKTVSLSKAMRQHFEELSIEALKLASNLESYREQIDIDSGSRVGDVVYGGWLNLIDGIPDALSVKMRELNKPLALNLLLHLKQEFPELANISDWAQLLGDKISHDFIARLELKANRGDFVGNCHLCPGD